MKKMFNYVCLLFLFGFTQINGGDGAVVIKDYSKMSINELEEALVVAVQRNDQDAVKNLIQAGVNVNQEVTYTWSDYDDYANITCSVLEYACIYGTLAIVKDLLSAKPAIDSIQRAFVDAAREADTAIVEELVGCVSIEYRNIALDEATSNFPGTSERGADGRYDRSYFKDYLDVIMLLIKAGANVNYVGFYGNTPFMNIMNKVLYTEKQKESRAEIIQELLKEGADVNYANNVGDGALNVAIKKHHLDAVQILLKIPKININLIDSDGNTSLLIAVQHIKSSYWSDKADQYNDCINSQKIVEALFATPGINLFHVNNEGDTVVDLLARYMDNL